MADIIETFADGTTIERDFTPEEKAQVLVDKLAEEKRQQDKIDKANAKETAQVKLAALGLTIDELKALGL